MEPLSLSSIKEVMGFSKNWSLLSDNVSDSCGAVVTAALEVCLRPKKRQAAKQANMSFIQPLQKEGHFDFRGPMSII